MKYLVISILFILSVNLFGNPKFKTQGKSKEVFNVCVEECEDELDKTNKTTRDYFDFMKCVTICAELEKLGVNK